MKTLSSTNELQASSVPTNIQDGKKEIKDIIKVLMIDTSMEDLGSSDQKLISPENMYEIGVEKVAPALEGSDSAKLMSEMEYPAMSPDRADANTAIVIEMDPQYQDRADANTVIVIEMDPQYQVARCSPFWRQWVHRVTRKDSSSPCLDIRKDSSLLSWSRIRKDAFCSSRVRNDLFSASWRIRKAYYFYSLWPIRMDCWFSSSWAIRKDSCSFCSSLIRMD